MAIGLLVVVNTSLILAVSAALLFILNEPKRSRRSPKCKFAQCVLIKISEMSKGLTCTVAACRQEVQRTCLAKTAVDKSIQFTPLMHHRQDLYP